MFLAIHGKQNSLWLSLQRAQSFISPIVKENDGDEDGVEEYTLVHGVNTKGVPSSRTESAKKRNN